MKCEASNQQIINNRWQNFCLQHIWRVSVSSLMISAEGFGNFPLCLTSYSHLLLQRTPLTEEVCVHHSKIPQFFWIKTFYGASTQFCVTGHYKIIKNTTLHLLRMSSLVIIFYLLNTRVVHKFICK